MPCPVLAGQGIAYYYIKAIEYRRRINARFYLLFVLLCYIIIREITIWENAICWN